MEAKKMLLQMLCATTRHVKCLDVDEDTGEWFDFCSLCGKRWKNKDLNKTVLEARLS